MNFTTTINKIQFTSKPNKKDIANINNGFETLETDLTGLANYIRSGCTFCPSVFNQEQRKNDNFLSTQIFALDFDEGHEPTEKLNNLRSFGIEPNLFYYSFSNTAEHPKYRIVILFDELITDLNLRRLIQEGLMNIAKDTDKACKDPARMFYGATNCEILNTEPNNLINIRPAIHSHLTAVASKNTNTTISKKLGEIGIKGEASIYINKDSLNFPKIEHYDFNKACSVSPKLFYFSNGGHLKYPQLRVLCTNFAYIKGGLKWVKEKMTATGTYKAEDFALLNIVERYGYLPEGIENFDESLIGTYKNLLALDRVTNKAEIIEHTVKRPLTDIRTELKTFMNRTQNAEVLNNLGYEVANRNIVKASVGTGKTEMILSQLVNSKLLQKNTLIAVPSHQLKDELAQRIADKGIQVNTTPAPPKFIDSSLQTQYDFFNKTGDTNKASKLITSIAERLIQATEDDVITAIRYLDDLKRALYSEAIVITTHRRAMLTPEQFKHKTHIIFDEDPFKEFLPISTLSRSQVNNILNGEQLQLFTDTTKDKQLRSDVITIITYLDSLTHGVIEPKKDLIFRDLEGLKNKLSHITGGEAVLSFLSGEFHLRYLDDNDKEIFYSVKKQNISTQKSITIFSATADEFIYKKLLPEAHFYDLGIAENKGKVIQHTGKMYSKNQLRKKDFKFKHEPKEDTQVITFLEHKGLFENSNKNIHFGNTTGFDGLKGVNIDVIGTPIQNPIVIYLYAKALGIDITLEKQQKAYREIIFNGCRISVMTFIDDELAQLDLRLSLMEIEQAAGRSRTTITNSEVNIFSSLPSQMTDIFDPE
jgi:hypothetical protein